MHSLKNRVITLVLHIACSARPLAWFENSEPELWIWHEGKLQQAWLVDLRKSWSPKQRWWIEVEVCLPSVRPVRRPPPRATVHTIRRPMRLWHYSFSSFAAYFPFWPAHFMLSCWHAEFLKQMLFLQSHLWFQDTHALEEFKSSPSLLSSKFTWLCCRIESPDSLFSGHLALLRWLGDSRWRNRNSQITFCPTTQPCQSWISKSLWSPTTRNELKQ